MTAKKSTSAPAKPPRVVYTDARITLTEDELRAAANKAAKGKGDKWWQDYTHVSHGAGEPTRMLNEVGARKLIEEAVRAINFERCGHPEGTIAYSPETGMTARRFWSRIKGKLMWLITEPATGEQDEVAIDANEKLPVGVGWGIAHSPAWPVTAAEE